MAKGRAPKDPANRIRRNIDPTPTTVIEIDGLTYGPELPEEYLWHARTLIWWDNWRTAANAKNFTNTDWDFLLDTALLHTAMWNGENTGAEVRLRVCKMGATPEDRQRQRLVLKNGDAPVSVSLKVISGSRKTRLLKVVGEELNNAVTLEKLKASNQ